MPHWLYILLLIFVVIAGIVAWRLLSGRAMVIALVIVAAILFGLSISFTASLGHHKAHVSAGAGPSATTTTSIKKTPGTKKVVKTPTSTTITVTPTPTAPAVTTPAIPPAPAGPGNPSTGSLSPGTPPVSQTYQMDGKVHVYVDLNKSVHDGQLAHFTFKVVNGTSQTIRFTRAAALTNLDGMGTPIWTPVYDLNGAGYQTNWWWVRTGDIASGQVVEFDGKVPIPERNPSRVTSAEQALFPNFNYQAGRHDATVDCLWGLLQVEYPGKPNASIDSPVKSEQPSCAEYSAS